MPSRWKSTRRSIKLHPIPVALVAIAFYAYDFDSHTVDLHWDGIGKYLNYAYRFFEICCVVLFLIGALKKRLNFMRPVLYAIASGALFAGIIALCYCLGWDMTGGNQYPADSDNSTHIEGLNATTTSIPQLEANTTETPCPGGGTPMRIPQVYVFCIMRTFFTFLIWMMHFFTYTDKLDEIEPQESDESHNNMVPRVMTTF